MLATLTVTCACVFVTRYYMFALGIPIAISIPSITSMVAAGGSMFPLLLFYGGTVAVVSFYGGLFSVLPAYLADVFGPVHSGACMMCLLLVLIAPTCMSACVLQKNASAIHGRALTAWSAAALCGPPLLGTLRGWSYDSAVRKLAVSVDAERFREAYGAGSYVALLARGFGQLLIHCTHMHSLHSTPLHSLHPLTSLTSPHSTPHHS